MLHGARIYGAGGNIKILPVPELSFWRLVTKLVSEVTPGARP